ncbi:hypothetical protein K466DRAFT_588616 [Polyporus arcularius HHB13444]|uniref:Uncharacterized protein n=1 Tax=Polyporus arcularius HHB13444 TaxID=1314778 RepID=A0A5C3P8D1_9APHY|nr:hypothetical protein K466DRAFT_588616 [Polyporus arcularius HHB13444]
MCTQLHGSTQFTGHRELVVMRQICGCLTHTCPKPEGPMLWNQAALWVGRKAGSGKIPEHECFVKAECSCGGTNCMSSAPSEIAYTAYETFIGGSAAKSR